MEGRTGWQSGKERQSDALEGETMGGGMSDISRTDLVDCSLLYSVLQRSQHLCQNPGKMHLGWSMIDASRKAIVFNDRYTPNR